MIKLISRFSGLGIIIGVAFLIFNSCDMRRLKDQDIPSPARFPDSLRLISSTTSDTIKLYSSTKYGEISLRIDPKGIGDFSGYRYPVKFNILTPGAEGIFSTLLGPFYDKDTALSGNVFHSIKYYPSGPKGWHSIEIVSNNGVGRKFRDTVRFYVDSYQKVPFSISLNKHDLDVLRPSEFQKINLNVLSSDITKNMQYFITYSLTSSAAQAYLKTDDLLNDISQNSQLAYNGNSMTLKLNNHIDADNMWLYVTVTDLNGDIQKDSLVYDVRANENPLVNSASVTITKICTGYYNSGVCTNYSYGRGSFNTLNRRQNDCQFTYTVNINATDPITGHSLDGLSKYKVTYYGTGIIYSGDFTTPLVNKYILSFSKNVTGWINAGPNQVDCLNGGTRPGTFTLDAGAIFGPNNTPGNNGTQVGISVMDKDGVWSTEYITTIPANPKITSIP